MHLVNKMYSILFVFGTYFYTVIFCKIEMIFARDADFLPFVMLMQEGSPQPNSLFPSTIQPLNF